MKNLVIACIAFLGINLLTACQDDNNAVENDALLIQEIANSTEKTNVEPEDLPRTVTEYTESTYFEAFVESAAYVSEKGYEITLTNEDVLYCDRDGNPLHARFRPHRPGPCGHGGQVEISELPDAIADYVTENYPDAEIKKAKQKGEKYIVAITGHILLIFESDGTFIDEAPIFRLCRGERIALEDLADEITNYITENYPDAEIKIAFRARGKIMVGIMTDDGRKLLVFDLDGNFLFERG